MGSEICIRDILIAGYQLQPLSLCLLIMHKLFVVCCVVVCCVLCVLFYITMCWQLKNKHDDNPPDRKIHVWRVCMVAIVLLRVMVLCVLVVPLSLIHT